MNCSFARLQLHAYLDAELPPAEALALEAHLVDCASCRDEYEALRAIVETVRGAHGLYEPPEQSRRRAAELIASHRRREHFWHIAAVAAILLAGVFFFRSVGARLSSANTLAEFAAESHRQYADGTLPLDIRSDQPDEVASWLSGRLPFHLTLPNYPEPPGATKKYMLEGARLMQLDHEEVAYLAYSMDNRPISLLLTSSAKFVPSGGDIYHSEGLAFHSALYKGLRVITWSDKGLNYALVSELATGGAESCMVCHGSESERGKFAPLKPRT